MTAGHVGHFRDKGYAIVRGVFSAAEAAALARAFDRIYAQGLERGRSWRNHNTFFYLGDDAAAGRIVRYVQWASWIDETLERTRRDPRLLEILAPLIGRDLKQIINQMHWKPPGAMAEFGLHQDSRSRHPRDAYRDLANSYVQTAIAVDPHTEENGAMVVCPESHRLGELPYDRERRSMDVALDDTAEWKRLGVDTEKKVVLDMAPGDVALWHVHTLHGSGPNRATIDRRLYINGYVIADNCDRGEWAFRDGKPCKLEGAPSLVHYEDLYTNPGPRFVD